MKIGFIGLGIMGRPMVRNLIEAGYLVMVYDIMPESMSIAEGYGAVKAQGVRVIAEQCNVIFTMLPNSAHVEETVMGDSGILAWGQPGALLIDTSSISPVMSKHLAEALMEKGLRMIDAPVSGGEGGAVDKSLSIMVGGEEEVFREALPILQAVGRDIIHVGSNGAGSMVKLANQIMVNVNMAAMAEAVVFAQSAGIDVSTMHAAVRGGAAGSAVLDAKIPKIAARDFLPGGPVAINAKDLQNVMETGREMGVPLPLTAQVLEMFRSLMAHGHARTDHSGLVLHYELLANQNQPLPEN